ncbi:hypothetical protein GCM10027082_39510 [Comamonas humi]
MFKPVLAASAAALSFSVSAAGFADCPRFFPAKPPTVSEFGALRELCFDEFAVLHSGETKTPIYVVQRLNARMLKAGRNLKRKDDFYPEARLPFRERAQLEDYRRSGFSRGHMAPAGDMSTPQGKAQTFSLANIVPQDATHNGEAWQQIEKDTRSYIRRIRGDVYVITGPVFRSPYRTVGGGQVRVPEAIFKLVYDSATEKSWVYWQRNAADTRVTPPISYAEFVNRTGLRFLP